MFSVGGRARRRRRLLPVRGQEPALRPRRAPKGDKSSFMGDQRSIEVVREAVERLRRGLSQRPGGRDGGAGAVQRRDDGGLRATARWPPLLAVVLTLGAHVLAASGGVGKPHPHAGACSRVEPRLVDRAGHALVGHLTHLLGDVHLDRHGHRDRLRHLLPVPLRGGDLPRPQPERGPRASPRAGPARACSWAPSPPPARSTSSSLTDFRGIQELGFISGIAILLVVARR